MNQFSYVVPSSPFTHTIISCSASVSFLSIQKLNVCYLRSEYSTMTNWTKIAQHWWLFLSSQSKFESRKLDGSMMKFPGCSISFTTRCLLVIIGISLTYIMVNGKLDYTNHAYNYNREELHRITSCSDPYPLKVDENCWRTWFELFHRYWKHRHVSSSKTFSVLFTIVFQQSNW